MTETKAKGKSLRWMVTMLMLLMAGIDDDKLKRRYGGR
jgi:hypothetical protein